MACELIGAKILAPYFGTSLYVWSAALGLTLGGLMCGYFTGGILSRRYANQPALLYWVLIAAGAFTVLMPFTSEWIMLRSIHFNLQMGAILSLLVFMFPPLVFMGMTSPIIINLLNTQVKDAGSNAGKVYAISTLGGILTTFLMGFYIIPVFGVALPAIVTGLVLAFLPAISLLRLQKWGGIASLLLLGVLSLTFYDTRFSGTELEGTIHYHSEGILGQVKVIDLPATENPATPAIRGLIVNNTLQTVLNLDDPASDFWGYTHYLPQLAATFPAGSRVLLLGMGGGTLVNHLRALHFEIDVVEIDGRMRDIAIQYFGMSDEIPVYVDDARHFIKTCKGDYDIIIFDTFISESAPEHVMTREGMEDAVRKLRQGGRILVNFYGYLEGSRGEIVRSFYKTLSAAGLYAHAYATPGPESDRNIIFLAATENFEASEEVFNLKGWGAQHGFFLEPDEIDTTEAVVLTDRYPQLELYARASADWRRLYNQRYTSRFSQYKIR